MAGKPGPKHQSIAARQALWKVFADMGGAAGMKRWAEENPTEFYTKLFPRLVPQLNEISGVGGDRFEITVRLTPHGEADA